MDLIGKTTIHPVLFFSGKILGYFTWIVFCLLFANIEIFDRHTISYAIYISYFTFTAGLIFIVISLINLGRSTRLGLPKGDTSFKTTGLYRFSRNPMYVGFNLLTISSMIFTMNIWILVAGVYSILIYHLIILGEERFLEERFGQNYNDYRKRTRRYL